MKTKHRYILKHHIMQGCLMLFLLFALLVVSGCQNEKTKSIIEAGADIADIGIESAHDSGKILVDTTRDVFIEDSVPATVNDADLIRIANWNLQIFGRTKAGKFNVMMKYVNEISKNDIFFVQEIRDGEGTAFVDLCSMLPETYMCAISNRAGRSSSKEQYGVIYDKTKVELSGWKDYEPDNDDRWERPPIRVDFRINGDYNITVWNLHSKPDDVKMELFYLEGESRDNGRNVMIIGDLNADCDYYNTAEPEFDGWNWLIPDSADTTVSSTDCAYDRIIVNNELMEEVVDSGVYKEGINEEHSDHYIVYATIIPVERND